MSTNRLWNSLTFTNVADGATVALPHGLTSNGKALVPDFGWLDKGDFTPTADATNVSVTNNTGGVTTVHVLVCAIHSVARVFGGSANLSPKPFWVVGSQGLSSTSSTSSNLVTWTAAKTWTEVYAEIQALNGPVICLVEALSTARVMTAEGGGAPTDLTNVQFLSIVTASWHDTPSNPANVDLEDGFVLGLDADGVAVLNGVNVNFFAFSTTTPIVDGTPFALTLNGGQFAGGAAAAVGVTRLVASLSNEASVGASGATIILADGSHNITLQTGARVANDAIVGEGTTPITIWTDGSCSLSPSSFTDVALDFQIQGQAGSMALSFGNQSVSTAVTQRYLDPGYNQGTAGTALIGVRAPVTGLLHRLAVQLNAADAAAQSIKCDIFVDDASTGLQVILPANAVGGGIDLDHTFLVFAGQIISAVVTRTDVLTSGNIKIAAVVELFPVGY